MMSASREAETRGLLDQEETESEQLEGEGGSKGFCSLAKKLRKKKQEESSKQGFLPSFFSKQAPSVPVETKGNDLGMPLTKFITTQRRIEELLKAIDRYKKHRLQIFSAGLKLAQEAYDLLETDLSAKDILSLNNSLESAINLAKTPNDSTVDAAHHDVKVAIGHEDKFKKYGGAFLVFIGVVTTLVSLMFSPPFCLVGFSLCVSGAMLFKRGEKTSVAQALDSFADKVEVVAKCYN